MFERVNSLIKSTSNGVISGAKTVDKYSGSIACGCLIIAATASGAIVIAPILITVSAGGIAAITIGAQVSGCAGVILGAYSLGKQHIFAEEQEQGVVGEETVRNVGIELGQVEAETALIDQKNNDLSTVADAKEIELNPTIAQLGLLLINLNARVDNADERQAEDQMTQQRQHDELDRALRDENASLAARLSHLEGLLAHGMFPVNPDINLRGRPAANDVLDEGAPRQRGRPQPRV